MRPLDGDESLPLGMAHAPISHKQFKTWGATFILKGKLNSKDLKGYQIWKKENGSYF